MGLGPGAWPSTTEGRGGGDSTRGVGTPLGRIAAAVKII